MVSLVLQHFIDLAHNPTAPPQQLARRRHSGARAGGAATARADRPCLFIVKRRMPSSDPKILSSLQKAKMLKPHAEDPTKLKTNQK